MIEVKDFNLDCLGLCYLFTILKMSDLSAESDNLSSASNSSNEEDLEEVVELLEDNDVRPKNINYFEQIIPQYGDQVFLEHFRVSRHVASEIAERFAVSIYYKTHGGCYGQLSPLNVIYVFL